MTNISIIVSIIPIITLFLIFFRALIYRELFFTIKKTGDILMNHQKKLKTLILQGNL